jgi:hypothetical protein
MRSIIPHAATLIALVLTAPVSAGQSQVVAARPLRVFVDCNSMGCDLDFFRTEIPYVDYVRDRADATVHVLVSTQSTGSGGREYTMNFIGLREFAGVSDTLAYVSAQSATNDELRKGIAQTLKLGFVRYIARTPAGSRLQVTYTIPVASAVKGETKRDPWDYWVFRTRASGNFNGESSQNFVNLNGSVSANRITKAWKISNSANVSYSESNFTFSEGEKFSSYSRSYGFSELIVKSMGEHWSAGQRASVTSSTYLNSRHAIRFAPAVEYDVFPYSQSTRKLLTFQYSIGVSSYAYHDTTIFEKISEVRPNQTLSVALSATQPWGSVSSSIEGATLLDDFSKRHLVLFNSVNARLFKGFSLNMFGSVSLLRDQLYLAKGGATDEEILLQRRQLSTSYSYFAGVGITYTFGSIFNNVVNPRFEGASGTFYFF